MANPDFANRPIILLDKELVDFTVSVWMPPQGIWQCITSVERYPNLDIAQRAASCMGFIEQSTIAVTFTALNRQSTGTGPASA